MPLPAPLVNHDSSLSSRRRSLLQLASGGLVSAWATQALAASASDALKVEFSPVYSATEAKEESPQPALPPSQRIGFAIVGLGRLAVNQILPAFSKSKFAKPVALVSGDHDKALKLAKQYGIAEASIYDYKTYDRLADNADVQVIYIVLPNGLHAEYTVRGARAGKHILCEKPMANSVAECQQMIDACRRAERKLMVAYRMQYEPKNRAIIDWRGTGKLGILREFVAVNSQSMGDPNHWRLKRALAGGGPLPDVGIYCLNAARFLSNEEPSEVIGQIVQPADDPRFKEVEASCQFMLRFPSGFAASCSSSYTSHESRAMRLLGDRAWVAMDPAFSYTGLRLKIGMQAEGRNAEIEPNIESGDQFAHELDHMAQCVLNNRTPHTPGEEGLQDQRIIEAIYQSARDGRPVKLNTDVKTRGPEPEKIKA